MKLILRNKSVLTGKSNLEKLVTLKKFPVFFGCTEQDPKEDIFADMKWSIDPENGVIQLTELIPSEKILPLLLLSSKPLLLSDSRYIPPSLPNKVCFQISLRKCFS